MARSIKMRVLKGCAGNHDPRILAGEGVTPANPKRPGDLGSICWRGGEIIFVTEELADNYERHGWAERFEKAPEAAAMQPAETAVMPTAKKHVADLPIRDSKNLDVVGAKAESGIGKATVETTKAVRG